MVTSFERTRTPATRRCRSNDQCAGARPDRGPSPHSAERSASPHRLPAVTAGRGPLDGPRPPVKNAVSTVKTIKTFDVPVVHSTINVATGRGQPTLPELADLLADDKPLDRTTTNSWEDIEFRQAVRA